MSCNCIGNEYIDSNGNFLPLTEYMCFDIIANNAFCCDDFGTQCLNRVYFDIDSPIYEGCYNCPSTNPNCCLLIQSEANKLNPEANSKCCENFDSYCVQAYETLKNTKGNFCSDVSSLKDYYVSTYSTEDRPCAFTDKKADECLAELDCTSFNSVQCIDSLYNKLTDETSACQCTCLKQANFLSECMLHVIHREPTCCHSWTAECENIRKDLEISQGNVCSISPQIGLGLGGGGGGGNPGTISCGCTVRDTSWGAMPCDLYKFFCDSPTASALGYNCATQSVSEIIEDYMYNQTSGLCTNTDLNWGICNINGSSDCTDFFCTSCEGQGIGPAWGDEWYDVILECDACAGALAYVIFPDLDLFDCNAIDAAIANVRLAASIIKIGEGGSVSAANCGECCSICRFLGQESESCPSQCGSKCIGFVIEETPDENSNDNIVYEGQGITFTTKCVYSPYLYYELIPVPSLPFIDKNDIADSGLGANNIPLGMTGIVSAIGTDAIVHIKFANDGINEGSEYFKFKAYELTKFENCPYGLASSATIEVKEPITYTLFGVPVNCQVNEGQTLSLRINTTNAPSGTIYYRIVSVVGASQNDFGIDLEGSRQIVSSIMTLDIPITADSTTELAEERFRVQFSRTSDFANIIATTDTQCPNGIRIIDTSQTDLSVNVLLNGSSLDAVIEEGSIATFRVESNRDGDFYYKINTNGTNFSALDLENSANPPADIELEDLFTVSNGFANIYKKIKADFTTESSESFKLEVRLNSTQGPLVATSPTALINDSSGNPTFNISGPSNVVEGESYVYNITTTNSPYSTLWYRIVPVGESEITVDDFNIPLSGSFALSFGLYDLTLLVATDLELEGPEQFRIELWPSNNFGNVVNRLARTGVITLQDSTQDITISSNTSIVTEGQSVIFTVDTVNISDNTLTYEIIPTLGNIEASDFTSGSLIGSFILTDIGGSKTGNFTLTLVNNLPYEGEEKFVVNIYDSSSSLLITSGEIKVTDAEPTYGIVPSTNLVTEGNSFTVTVNTTNYPNPNVYYRIDPVFGAAVDASDFEDGLEGAIPITSSSVVHTIQTLEKSIFSGTRGFRIVISDILNGLEKASSSVISLQDASPTYEIEVPGFVLEGESFEFTVNTTNLPNNTTLYYKINGLSVSDVIGGLTGSFVVTGNTKTVTIQTADNSAYEGPETFTIQIFDNVSLTPPAKVESTTITLLDGTPTYGPLSPDSGTIAEGGTQVFTFTTTNVATGTVLYYDIIPESGNLNANDFSPPTLSGSFTVGSSFSITTAINPEAEPNESFKIQISSVSDPEYISNVFQIDDTDTTPDYQLTISKSNITEGLEGVTFTLQTTNVTIGTEISYVITAVSGNITASDFTDGKLSGTITVNASGVATLYKEATSDCQHETPSGPEQFQVVFSKDSKPVAYSPIINILDPAASFTSIEPFGCINGCGCEEGKVREGTNVTFTVTGCNIPNNFGQYRALLQRYPFTTGFDNSDVTPSTQNLTFNNNTSTFTVFINNTGSNTLYESGDSFVVKIRPVGAGNDLLSSGCFTIIDALPTGTVTPSVSSVSEGDTITFNIVVQNVPNNSSIQYEIIGLSEEDLIDGQLTGNITVTASGNDYIGSVTKRISTDSVLDEVESLVFVIYYNAIELDRTDEISIIDTSQPEIPTYTLSISRFSLLPGETFTATLTTTNVDAGTEFQFRLQEDVGFILNPDDFDPNSLDVDAILPAKQRVSLSWDVLNSISQAVRFKVAVYRKVDTLLGTEYQLVALSQLVQVVVSSPSCPDQPFLPLCSVCDSNCGYTTYFGTKDAFVGYYSQPSISGGVGECQNAAGCQTLSCCTVVGPDQVDCTNEVKCGCREAISQNSVSYVRFSNKQFISEKINGVYRNRKITDEELTSYLNKTLRVPIYYVQGHEFLCRTQEISCLDANGNPQSLEYSTSTPGARLNTACLAGQGDGFIGCRYYYNPDTGSYLADTTSFSDVGPSQSSSYSTGIKAVRDMFAANADTGSVSSSGQVQLPGVIPIGGPTDLFGMYKCENINYFFGADNPPVGIVGVYGATHLNSSFTPNLCNLIDVCSLGQDTGACSGSFQSDCKSFMTETCIEKAVRYALITGCAGATGFTLENEYRQSPNKTDFVYYFQGINSGVASLNNPADADRNNCFTYVEFPINEFQCARMDFFGDSVFYSDETGTWPSLSPPPYEEFSSGACDAGAVIRNSKISPPQHTGCCFKETDIGPVTGQKQFDAIDSFRRISQTDPNDGTALLRYVKSIFEQSNSNTINFGTLTDNGPLGIGTDGYFFAKAICEYMMPRSAYWETNTLLGEFSYGYGYKGAAGQYNYEPSRCGRYHQYEYWNTQKEETGSNPISGYDGYFSIEGELNPVDPNAQTGLPKVFESGIKNPLRSGDTERATAFKIVGHSSDSLLPDNNPYKFYNACYPCRGFIDIPPRNFDTADFKETEGDGATPKKLIIKAYTRTGNYSDHTVGSILARMTLRDQIRQGNIYNQDVAEFAMILLGSGIEILHTREVTYNEFFTELKWNLSNGITHSSESRAYKLHQVYADGGFNPLSTLQNPAQSTSIYYWPYKNPTSETPPTTVGDSLYFVALGNPRFLDFGGAIGNEGQHVSSCIGENGASILNPVTVYANYEGEYPDINSVTGFKLINSDRNVKFNNSIGILRVHKEVSLPSGKTLPICREKFETRNRTTTNCDLPNNIVMNGMCWITSVFAKELWEILRTQLSGWTTPNYPNPSSYENFEDWINDLPSSLLTNQTYQNFFFAQLETAILDYKITLNNEEIPVKAEEELYLMKRNNSYVYTLNDLRVSASYSRANEYSCYEGSATSLGECNSYFSNCELGFCATNPSGESFRNGLINLYNSLIEPDLPNTIEEIPNSSFTTIASYLVNFEGCVGTSAADVKRAYTDLLAPVSCVFQYNNKTYKIMKNA